jgi:hypothetical protein
MQLMQSAIRAMRLAVLACVLAAVSSAAHAQQPSASALATAKEIIIAQNGTAVLTPLIPGVVEQAKLLLLQQNPSLSKVLNEVGDQMRTEMAPRFDELTNEMARLYASRFTEQELKDVLAFYKSPLGKKVMTEQPVITEQTLNFAQTWANSLSDVVLARMRDELKKRGYSL